MNATGLTRDRIKRLIVEHLHLDGISPGEIDDDAPLFADAAGGGLGLDSVDALELVVGLEKQFGVRIDDQAVDREALATVTRLAQLVDGLRGAEGGAG